MTKRNENIDTSIGSNDMFHARNMIILQKFLKAKEILQAVITKRKKAASPHFHLGFVYVELMCHPKALEHFKQAARLKPQIQKYRQVETWFSPLYDTDKSLKSKSDFMKAIAALLYDINPTKFEYIYNATNEQKILLALNDAILLYHPMNHHMENVQQFLLNKYSYLSLTQYKNYCLTHFDCTNINRKQLQFPGYSSRLQQRSGHQMVVEKARSFYPREPITHSTNGKYTGGRISSSVSDEEWLKKNKNYIFLNKLKRMCLIYGYIRKNIFNPIADMIQLIDIFFHQDVWEFKAVDRIAVDRMGYYSGYTTYFDLVIVSKGECPFQFKLSYDRQNSVDLFLSISKPKVVTPFIKIYYELYVYDGNKKNIYMKGTMKYRCQDERWTDKDNKISSRLQLFTNNNNINLLIRFLSVEYLRFENYLKHITIKQNVSFKWTISTNFKHKPESSIQFSENFANNNWCIYYARIKNPTHKKKKKFYVGVMLIKLPSPLNHLKIQLNIFNDDKKNTKVFVNKVWPGFESALQIPFKYEILYQQSLSIHVNIKILNAFDHKGKKINIKDA